MSSRTRPFGSAVTDGPCALKGMVERLLGGAVTADPDSMGDIVPAPLGPVRCRKSCCTDRSSIRAAHTWPTIDGQGWRLPVPSFRLR
jgi:hypothetical protein